MSFTINGLIGMHAKNAITIIQRTMFVNQKSVQHVDVIHMLIGLTDIFVSHTKEESEVEE